MDTADPRVAADVMGHSDIHTTLMHYLSRGKAHPEVATMVKNAVLGKVVARTMVPIANRLMGTSMPNVRNRDESEVVMTP